MMLIGGVNLPATKDAGFPRICGPNMMDHTKTQALFLSLAIMLRRIPFGDGGDIRAGIEVTKAIAEVKQAILRGRP